MKTIQKIGIAAAFALAVGIAAGYHFFVEKKEDKTPPVIKCDCNQIKASIETPMEDLLLGVTAWDERDGDVSESLFVEGVSKFIDPGKSRVTFVALDHSGNVAKHDCEIVYEDYTRPKFYLKDELRFSTMGNGMILDVVGASDCLDGDISNDVKMTVTGGSLYSAGTCTVQFRVTNSMGDTVYLEAPVTIFDSQQLSDAYAPEIGLKEYLVYLDKNRRFDPKGMIENITVHMRGEEYYALGMEEGETTIPISRYGRNNVTVDSDLDTAEPGVYQVRYTTTMDGYTGVAVLLVIVEGED